MAFDVQQLCLDIPKVYRAMRGAAEAKDQHLGATGKTDRWSVQTLGVAVVPCCTWIKHQKTTYTVANPCAVVGNPSGSFIHWFDRDLVHTDLIGMDHLQGQHSKNHEEPFELVLFLPFQNSASDPLSLNRFSSDLEVFGLHLSGAS